MRLSFEVFPPKTGRPSDKLFDTIDRLVDLKPDMMSVTQGAGGTNAGQQKEVLEYIVHSGVPALANLTCIDKSLKDVDAFVADMKRIGVKKILGLRGDLPEGRTDTGGDFQYGVRLLQYLYEKYPEMELYAPAYPEGHIEDTEYEKAKHILLEKALYARMCITQMCLTKQVMNEFAFFCSLRNYIGVMPITDKDRIIRMCVKNGVAIPSELMRIMGRYDGEDFRKAGLDYTVELVRNAAELKTYGIQIFSMNDADAVEYIVKGAGLR